MCGHEVDGAGTEPEPVKHHFCSGQPDALKVLAEAFHVFRHDYSDLWEVDPRCGCEDWAQTLLNALDKRARRQA